MTHELRSFAHATIFPGNESGYVAECAELCVVTQGDTLHDAAKSLREAIELALKYTLSILNNPDTATIIVLGFAARIQQIDGSGKDFTRI